MFVRVRPRLMDALAKALTLREARGIRIAGSPVLREIDDSGARLTGKMRGRLKDVLDHPELYAEEPRLKGVLVRFDGSGIHPISGKYDGLATPLPGFRKIVIRKDLPEEERLGTILHEAQHQADSLQRVPGGRYRGSAWSERPEENVAEATRKRRRLSPLEREAVDPTQPGPYGVLTQERRMAKRMNGLQPEDYFTGGLGLAGAGAATYGASQLRPMLQALLEQRGQ